MRPPIPPYMANFDSASAMLRATSNFIRGKDYPTIGLPRAVKPFVRSANLLPKSAREFVFAAGGANEGYSPKKLHKIDSERVARWATQRYPQTPCQAVMIGSTNGALVHLAAALGTPWLPQNALLPVRRFTGDNNDPKSALAFGQELGQQLLDNNPDLQLHHMHDANQDRLMVKYMEYFRVKRLSLGRAYEQFLQSRLMPGGTIIVVDCQRQWPSTQLSHRQIFQHGALGGASEEAFLQGSDRVEEYLERYGSKVRRWDSAESNSEQPEAEWGFEPAMREDILRFAHKHGYRVRNLSFYEPEHLSPLVADFHRDWYRARGIKANRLLVESFTMMEPYWALRTGSVPFWMKFNMDPSAECLECYLDSREAFDDINLMLFNPGVEAVGFPQIDRWKRLLGRAKRRGRILGVRDDLYPRDFGSLARYHSEVKKMAPRYPLPGPLTIKRFDDFLDRAERQYEVEFSDAE